MRTKHPSLGLGLCLLSTMALAGVDCAKSTSGGSGGGGGGGTGTGGTGLAAGNGGATGSGGSTGNGGSATDGSGTGGGSGRGGTTGNGGAGAGAGTIGSGGAAAGGGTTGNGGATAGGGTTGKGGAAGNGAGGIAGGKGTGGSGAGTGGKGGQAGGGPGGSNGFVPYTCPTGVSSPTTLPAGSAATRIAGAPPSDTFNGNSLAFTTIEGPVWIGNALYVSEIAVTPSPPTSRILKIDANDAVTMFYPAVVGMGTSGSNGLAVDPLGRLVSANHGVGGIVAFNIATRAEITPPLVDTFDGKRFNSPNDLTIRSDGTIYFTDPSNQAPTPQPQPGTGVYMLAPGAATAVEILSNLVSPNGVALSLDEHTLYVGFSTGVNSYEVDANGTIDPTATVVDAAFLSNNATDGMAIDCAGDLYVVRVTTHDVDVVAFGDDPGTAGTHLGLISGVPGGGPLSNVAFGGADHKTLYITTQGQGTGAERGVFKLPMPIPGMPY